MKQNTNYTKLKIMTALFAVLLFKAEAKAADDLPNLHTVTANILRGGRPTIQGLKILVQKNVKTVIDIDDTPSAMANEKKYLSKTNVHYISIPINAFSTPSDADVKKIENLLNDSKNFPIYIHCKHGEDRTGLMIGLYRFEHGLSAADAYREMLDLGFHRILFSLDSYFKNKTHMN
jgi:tyrosine-protein phosphatase SIW14